MATLTGPDCSRHQGAVDWGAVAQAGHSFAFLKATDGVAYRWVDWFHANLPKVKAAGLVPGAYHFLLDHHPGAAQARYYVTEVNRAGGFGGVVPVVDIEREADGTTPRFEHLVDFVAEFDRLVPGRPILIYTGRWYWVGVLGDPPGGWALGPLWHSEYDGLTPIDADVANGPELEHYGGWTDCLVWQHTSSGTCPGVSGVCDLNLFYGDRAALLALAGDPTIQEDDDMALSAADKDWLIDVVGWLTQGKPNSTVNPKVPEWAFADDAGTFTLAKLAARNPTADQIADAVVARLPAGSVDVAAVGAEFRRVLAEVRVHVGGTVDLAGNLELAEG